MTNTRKPVPCTLPPSNGDQFLALITSVIAGPFTGIVPIFYSWEYFINIVPTFSPRSSDNIGSFTCSFCGNFQGGWHSYIIPSWASLTAQFFVNTRENFVEMASSNFRVTSLLIFHPNYDRRILGVTMIGSVLIFRIYTSQGYRCTLPLMRRVPDTTWHVTCHLLCYHM